jgi:protease-4
MKENFYPEKEETRKKYFEVNPKTRGYGCLLPALAGIGMITVAFFAMIFLLLLVALLSPAKELPINSPKIAVVHIKGEIGLSSGVEAEDIVRLLKRVDEDALVKAVVLRIDSPGGAAAASQEIADGVKKMKKPVVASVGNIAASGAYWIASACDRIVGNASSSVGSIGVIITIPTFAELFKKLGIKYVVVYKGKYKDMGNPARDLTPEEKQLLEKQANIIYRQFIRDIAENRHMPLEKVEQLATGEVFSGEEALQLGLIDRIGGFYDAVNEAKRLAGIKGKAEVVDYDLVLPSYLRFLQRYLSDNTLRLFLPDLIEKIPVAR